MGDERALPRAGLFGTFCPRKPCAEVRCLATREKNSSTARHSSFRSQRYNDPMTQQASELLQKALSLSEEERAELAGSLIESLDATVDEAAEAAWNQEIARRIEDLDSGKAKTIPWKEVRIRRWARRRLTLCACPVR